MTQQSLITRLKAVEEALCLAWSLTSIVSGKREVYSAALSDLRELIKEAEGQKPVARSVAGVTNTGYIYVKAIDRSISPQTNLYTALGEKQ